MTKLRVYEYAKELNMTSKEIVSILKRLNIPVNNHMSVIDEEAKTKINQFFDDIKRKAQEEQMKNNPETEKRPETKEIEQKTTETRQQNERDQKQSRNQQSNNRSESGRGRTSDQQNRSPRPDRGGQPQGSRPPRPDQRNEQRTDSRGEQRGPRPGGREGAREGGRGPRPDQNRGPQQNRGPRQDKGGFQQNRGPRQDGGSPGNRSNEKRSALQVPAAPVEEQTVPRRRSQPKKVKEKNTFDENAKKNKRLLKENLVKSINFDNERGEVVAGKKRNKNKRNRDIIYGENKETPTKISIVENITVGELANMISKDTSEIIKKLLMLGVIATINQEIDFDVVSLVCSEYGIEVEKKVVINEDEFETIVEQDDEADLVERPPVVTIMGHVDHGKTSTLDAIRETKVVATEAGGITQHIGAYQIETNGKKITFLDTPGHEAFTSMRARGAKVTDITILVVAADDGVMPQTVEAINHAKAAEVPIIVAINKMDKPSANPDRVKQELTEHGLQPEEWGGDTIFVPISALKREGLDELLEMVLLVSEVQELRANPNKRARGTVIEAELDKGKGPIATVLVQHGTLRVGDPIVVGTAYGRIRSMINDRGKKIKEAPPSTPVEITGLNSVPQAGDQFMVFEDDSKAKAIGERRSAKKREQELKKNPISLDDLFEQIKEGEVKELNVIIKADVQGSAEALRSSLEKIDIEGVRVRIIHAGVGAISESDVILASASNGIIIGFNVRPDPNARATAEMEKVDIRLHRVIYNVIEEIEGALKGMLDPEYEEKVIGQAEVRQIFKVSRIGTIAGSYVTDGKITRDSGVRVIRDGIVIYEGKLDALKRFKDDVKEVAQGYECGITVVNFNDIKEGDILEAFVMEEIAR